MSVTITNLINKALDKGNAKINGRMFLGHGVKTDLQEKYYISIESDYLTLRHWSTTTLELDLRTNSIKYYYGESKSDADSINDVIEYFNLAKVVGKFTYRPVNGGFLLIEPK